MKPLQFTFVALTTVLFGSLILSCNKDKTQAAPAETRSAEEQHMPPIMSRGIPGNAGGRMDQLRAGCPMVVQGADVTVTDTEGGVALTFTTDSGDVADLRVRVQNMARMYEMHQGKAGMMWHHMGGEGMAQSGPGVGGEGHMAGRGPMPAASTTMTDTDSGTRLELRPTDPTQLDALALQDLKRLHAPSAGWLPVTPVHGATVVVM